MCICRYILKIFIDRLLAKERREWEGWERMKVRVYQSDIEGNMID